MSAKQRRPFNPALDLIIMHCRDCKYIITENEHITNKCPKCGSIYLLPDEINNRNKITAIEGGSFSARLAASFAMFFASFVTGLTIWLLVFFFIGKAGEIFTFPIIFIGYFTALFTVLGFISPNKSLELLGWVWDKLNKFIKGINNYDGPL